jgi:uncharacterized protein involved in exopolysaccharide biosynthesis
MNQTDPAPSEARPSLALPYRLDDSIDLLEYLAALLRAKWILLGAALLGGGAAFAWAQIQPELYTAFTRLALVEQQHPGGVSPDNRRAPEMLTLMEHRFALDTPYENYRYRVLARMRSRRFTEWFLDNHAILPDLYPARWDSEAGDWRNGQSPDRNDAIFRFRQTIRQVHYNPENQLILVRIYWRDPEIAAAWANTFVEGFNTFMRERTIADAQRKIDYLKQAVDDARTVQMQNSLYRLMEAQAAKTMLAEASPEYALEVIDPATAPSHPAAPAVKKITLAGLFGTAFVGSGLVIAGVLLGKIRRALRNRPSPAAPAAGRPDPSP